MDIVELQNELEFYKTKFREFSNIIISLNQEKDLGKLLSEILTFGRGFTNCEAGTLYKYNDSSLSFSVVQNDTLGINLNDTNEKIKWENIPINQQTTKDLLSVHCAVNKKPINIDNIYRNNRYDFSGAKVFDKKNNYKTKSVLVVPIINPENKKLLGILQLINKKDYDGNIISFSKIDEELALSLASHSSIVLERLKGELQYLRDLSKQLEEQKQKLEYLANTDQLTKVANRLKFNTEYKKLFAITKTKQTPLTFIILDIDHFKSVNDTYGHKVGDYVLSTLANIVDNHVEDHIIFARWGGEEFVLLLPNTTDKYAYMFADEIRKKISLYSFEHVGTITCSFGVAQAKVDESEQSLIIRADEALYKSKENGRNMVTIATS